jgi:hypothetical protein
MVKSKKKVEKTVVIRDDELGWTQSKYLLKDYRIDGLPITAIKDPKYTIKALIEDKIESLSYISDLINHYMEEDPKMRDAASIDFGKYLKPEYQGKAIDFTKIEGIKEWKDFQDTVPDQEKCQTFTWNDFRKVRQERLNEYNLRQSLDVFAPSTLQIFPLAALLEHAELGCFKVIQDDCNDMVDFLKNVKKLTPVFLLILFSRMNEIERRFHYLMGYHRMRYERNEGTQKGRETINEKRSIKVKYVIEAYIKMINDPTQRAILENISELKMAEKLKAIVEPDLREIKTSKGIPVLTKTIRRKDIVWRGLGTDTIINILRNDRNKVRPLWYPWKGTSKTLRFRQNSKT